METIINNKNISTIQSYQRSREISEDGKSIIYIYDLSQFKDGHWEYLEYFFKRTVGDNVDPGNEHYHPLVTNEQLNEFLKEPWTRHIIHGNM